MNKKTIVAIGGGELKDFDTLEIDRAIVALSNKKKPKVLFIPTASNDSDGYWGVFQQVYSNKLQCKTDCLYLIKEKPNKKEISEKILNADIIYVGGGNTLKMLKVWKKNGLDLLLKKAYQNGIILAGLSAGAICWFRYGASDSRRFMNGKDQKKMMRIKGLDFIHCTASPHHIREKEVRDEGIIDIMRKTPGIGLALDDNSAIIIQNDKYKTISSNKESRINKVFFQKGAFVKHKLKSEGSIGDLLSKS